MSENLDVSVIGAGRAGLAMGRHLSRAACTFELYERHPRLGDSWRRRFDSLQLFSPRAFSSLPGLSVPGDPHGYPSKERKRPPRTACGRRVRKARLVPWRSLDPIRHGSPDDEVRRRLVLAVHPRRVRDGHGRVLGRVRECRGVSPVPGLFFLARAWQNSRASALLRGAGAEASDLRRRWLLPFLQAR